MDNDSTRDVELTSKRRDKILHCHANWTATASNTISDREYEAMLTEYRRYLARCPQFIVSLECSRRLRHGASVTDYFGGGRPAHTRNVQGTVQVAQAAPENRHQFTNLVLMPLKIAFRTATLVLDSKFPLSNKALTIQCLKSACQTPSCSARGRRGESNEGNVTHVSQ